MKRFRFPLRPVAILRAHQEMLAREAFASAVQAFVKSEQQVAVARQIRDTVLAELTAGRSARFTADAEIRALAAYERECAAVVEAEKAMKAAEEEMQRKRIEYTDAHRRLEVVHRLEEKARVAHRYETMHEEQNEFDDFATRRFTRRSLHSA